MKKVTLLAASVALALGLVACDKAPQAPANTESAATAPAVAAAPLKSGIDSHNFDPAVKHSENFFYSVNGKWLAETQIPSDKASFGAFHKLYDDSQLALRTIIEKAAAKTDKAPGSDEQKLGDFYQSYMNEAAIEALGIKPLAADLAKISALKDTMN